MFISRVYRKWLSIKYFKIYCSKFLNKKNLSKFPQWTVTQILTILLTFFKIVVRPLITKENLYLEILIRHSLLCSVLTLVCVFCCPVFIGSWKKKKKNLAYTWKQLKRTLFLMKTMTFLENFINHSYLLVFQAPIFYI